MTWRDPRSANDMVRATCENLRELAAAYSPILRFDDRERLFPILAESWLTHTTSAGWEADEVEEDDVLLDAWRRGTALCSARASTSTAARPATVVRPTHTTGRSSSRTTEPIRTRSARTTPSTA